MTEYPKPGVRERISGWFGGFAIRPGTIVDRYLLENLPEKILEFKLATEDSLAPIEKKMKEYEEDLNELGQWREESWSQIDDIKKRMERLELKYGVKQELVR